ncbi:helix-turn-helix domain-containing protein [Arthrobacter globiformis]|uniref:helix-turn-helix domain-containing protein n=1 Tax=Arthrobacter globiformis TaxID=1665 RepID=UPI0027D92166|nr:helix-turn-helix domain-containing protein [Arthrobacter globiformis]
MGTEAGNRPRFLTIEQVAEELNVGVPSIRALLKTGELRGIQIGGRGLWRISRQDVDDYIGGAYSKTAERIASGEIEDHLES